MKRLGILFFIISLILINISLKSFSQEIIPETIENNRNVIYEDLFLLIRLMDIEDREYLLSGKHVNRIRAAYILINILEAISLLDANPALKEQVGLTEEEKHIIKSLLFELNPEIKALNYKPKIPLPKEQEIIKKSNKMTKDLNYNSQLASSEETVIEISEEEYFYPVIEESKEMKTEMEKKEEFLHFSFSAFYNSSLLEGENCIDPDTKLNIYENTGEFFSQAFNIKLQRYFNDDRLFFDFVTSYDSLDLPENYEFERNHIYFQPRRFNYALNLFEYERPDKFILKGGILEPIFWSPYSVDTLSNTGFLFNYKKNLSILLIKCRYPRITWQDNYFDIHKGNFESWGLGVKYGGMIFENTNMNIFAADVEDNIHSLPEKERMKTVYMKDELEDYSTNVLNFSIITLDNLELVYNDIIILREYLCILSEKYEFTYSGGHTEYLGFEDLRTVFYSFQTFYDAQGNPIKFPEPLPVPYQKEEYVKKVTGIINEFNWILNQINFIISNDYDENGVIIDPGITGERLKQMNISMSEAVHALREFNERVKYYSENTASNYCKHSLIPLWNMIKGLNPGYNEEIQNEMNFLLNETYALMELGLNNISILTGDFKSDEDCFVYNYSLAIPTEPDTEIVEITRESYFITGGDLRINLRDLENSAIYSEVSIMQSKDSLETERASAFHSSANLEFGNILIYTSFHNIGVNYDNPLVHKKLDLYDQYKVLEHGNYPYLPGTRGGNIDSMFKIPLKDRMQMLFGLGMKTELWETERIIDNSKYGILGMNYSNDNGEMSWTYASGSSLFELESGEILSPASLTRLNGNGKISGTNGSSLTFEIKDEVIRDKESSIVVLRENDSNISANLNYNNLYLILSGFYLGEKLSPEEEDYHNIIFHGNLLYKLYLNDQKTLILTPEFKYKTRQSASSGVVTEKMKELGSGSVVNWIINHNFNLGLSLFYTKQDIDQSLIDPVTHEVILDIFNEPVSGFSCNSFSASLLLNYKPKYIEGVNFSNEIIQKQVNYKEYDSPAKEIRFHNKFRAGYDFVRKDFLKGNVEYINLSWTNSSSKENTSLYSEPKKNADLISLNILVNTTESSEIKFSYILNRLFTDELERNYSNLLIAGTWRF
ncbi:MAG: hypothetical protein PHV06_07420 [bacterium]|nr:hypothetical protein [bacterium]